MTAFCKESLKKILTYNNILFEDLLFMKLHQKKNQNPKP